MRVADYVLRGPNAQCGSWLACDSYVLGAKAFWAEYISVISVRADIGSALTAAHF